MYVQVLPLYVMETFHWDAFFIGLCFLPLFTPSFLSPQVGMSAGAEPPLYPSLRIYTN